MRTQFQVLVIPFRESSSLQYEYAAFRRAEEGYWQGIAGGGEGEETPLEAAIREANEEAGIPKTARYYNLQTTCSIPVYHLTARKSWPENLYVIPEYTFGVDCTGYDIILSCEHSDIDWGSFRYIHDRLYWDSNKVALWELNERLSYGSLEEPNQETR